MKTFTITLLIICSVVIAGSIISLDWHKRSPAPKPVTDTQASTATEQSAAETAGAPPPQPQPLIAPTTNATAQVAVASSSTPDQVAPTDSVNPVHKLVEALLSAKSKSEKQAAMAELAKNGQLEEAIADLKQMATANPNNAEIPATIGEADLNEAGVLSKDPAHNFDQMGILAMQADQEFNAALQINPKNWEAQFLKASAQYYWPANPQLNNQIVQNLTGLIDQQETMAPNPEFAQTYVLLGNEYQKIGQQDKAMATWQLGAQEYPNDPTLQKKLSGAPGQ